MGDIGGGFGQKILVIPTSWRDARAASAWAAGEVGRGTPREPDGRGPARHAVTGDLTMAFVADGRDPRRTGEFVADCGAFPCRGRSDAIGRGGAALPGPVPRMHHAPASRPRPCTPTPSGASSYRGPWIGDGARGRGAGRHRRATGIDPVELRRRNVLRAGRSAVRGPDGHDLRQRGVARSLEQAVEIAARLRRPTAAEQAEARGRRGAPWCRHRRVRRTVDPGLRAPTRTEGATIRIEPSGTVERLHRGRLDREQPRDDGRAAHGRPPGREHRGRTRRSRATPRSPASAWAPAAAAARR